MLCSVLYFTLLYCRPPLLSPALLHYTLVPTLLPAQPAASLRAPCSSRGCPPVPASARTREVSSGAALPDTRAGAARFAGRAQHASAVGPRPCAVVAGRPTPWSSNQQTVEQVQGMETHVKKKIGHNFGHDDPNPKLEEIEITARAMANAVGRVARVARGVGASTRARPWCVRPSRRPPRCCCCSSRACWPSP